MPAAGRHQHLEGQHGPPACREKRRLGLDLLNDVGLGATKKGFSSRDLLRERSCSGTECEEEQAGEESSFLEDATAATQKTIEK